MVQNYLIVAESRNGLNLRLDQGPFERNARSRFNPVKVLFFHAKGPK